MKHVEYVLPTFRTDTTMPVWIAMFVALLTYAASAQETRQIRLVQESDTMIRKVVRQGKSVVIAIGIERTTRGILDNIQLANVSILTSPSIIDPPSEVNKSFANNQAVFLLRAQGTVVGKYVDTVRISTPNTQIFVVIHVNIIPSAQVWTASPDVIEFGPLLPPVSSTRRLIISNASDSNLLVRFSNVHHPFYPSMNSVDIPSNDVVDVDIVCTPDSTDILPLTREMVLISSQFGADTLRVQLRLTGDGDRLALQYPSHIPAGPNVQTDLLVPVSFYIKNVGAVDISILDVNMFTGPPDIWQIDSTTLTSAPLLPGDSVRMTIVGRTDGSRFSRQATFEIQGGNDTIQALLARFTIGFQVSDTTTRFAFTRDTLHFGRNDSSGSERIRSVLVFHNQPSNAIITDYVIEGPHASRFYALHDALPLSVPAFTADTVLLVGTSTGTGSLEALLIVHGNVRSDTVVLYFSDSTIQPVPRDSTLLRVSSHDLRIGERSTVNIVTDSALASVSAASAVHISFDATAVIAVQGSEPHLPGRRSLWTNVSPGPWRSGDTVAQFDIIAALGVTDVSDLTIDSAILRSVADDTIECSSIAGRVRIIDAPGYLVNTSSTSIVMTVSPNPAHETTTLTYACEGEHRRLRLYNTLSNVVKDFTSAIVSDSGTVVLDVSDLPSGYYILRLDSDSLSYALKLAVQ